MGIANGSAILSSVGVTVLNAALIYPAGTTFVNGTFVTNTTGALSSAQVVGIAIDLGGMKLWARNGAGIWNGSPAADPATNVGGVDISSIGGVPIFPCQTFGNNGSFDTANFTGPFANVAPSGFAPWESAPAPPFRAALPLPFVLVDLVNNATVPFNEWESWADGQVIALGISATARAPLPPGAIIIGGRATLPYGLWLGWIDRSVAGFGAPAKRPPLPPSNLALVGVDRKATIPFATWLQYVDGLLG